MTVTIKMLAERAGVSIATVSLALNNDQRVAKATRDKIRCIADELDFVPSSFGRALQSGRSRLIGYLVSNVSVSFFSEILQSVGEECSARQYGLLLAVVVGSEKSEAAHLRLFRAKNVDGVIFSAAGPDTRKALLRMERAGIPVVACSSESFHPEIPDVVVDNIRGGELAASHLVKLGHRVLGYCFGHADSSRYKGAALATAGAGLPAPVCFESDESLEAALMKKRRPTGVVAYSDFHAIRVKHVAERVGLKIPADISVVGFDDIMLAGLPEFSFTTVAQPKKDIGRISVELLFSRMRGESAESRRLEPVLIERNSAVPPAGGGVKTKKTTEGGK